MTWFHILTYGTVLSIKYWHPNSSLPLKLRSFTYWYCFQVWGGSKRFLPCGPWFLIRTQRRIWGLQFISVQLLSHVRLCDPMNHSTPGLPVHHQLPGFTQTHIHQVSDAIQPSHPLSFPSPPASNPSQHQGLFQWVNSSHEVAKVLEFQLQHPGNTQDWSPLGWTGWISLQSKGISSLFQHHSSKASILLCSALFIVQLSHPYMTTGKTIALTRWTFVDKVVSLLFNMLSRLVITFLPRSKGL